MRAVELADAREAGKEVRQVRAEDAAVGVQLVDDDIFEVAEIVGPLCVVRQNSGIEHVGVCDDDVPLAARLPPLDGVRVAVVDEAVYPAVGEGGELPKLRELGSRRTACMTGRL